MPTLLITGANRGIGFEFVRQYAAEGWAVIACCRTPEKAEKLQAIAKANSAVRIEALDVTDDQSIAALAARLKDTAIDLLINNAGIYSGTGRDGSAFPDNADDISQNLGTLDATAWAKVLRVNTIAPLIVTEAFLQNLKEGTGKKIVNITSRMGSLSELEAQSGSIAYRSSKAALNCAMRTITGELGRFGITITNLHPGWVKTDMGGGYADMTPEQSVTHLCQTIATLQPENSGQFLNYDRQVIPW